MNMFAMYTYTYLCVWYKIMDVYKMYKILIMVCCMVKKTLGMLLLFWRVFSASLVLNDALLLTLDATQWVCSISLLSSDRITGCALHIWFMYVHADDIFTLPLWYHFCNCYADEYYTK
jgi:hypothetical protein